MQTERLINHQLLTLLYNLKHFSLKSIISIKGLTMVNFRKPSNKFHVKAIRANQTSLSTTIS